MAVHFIFQQFVKQNIKIEIFDFGWKNKLEIVSWPTLHKNQRKNKRLVNYWKKIVYFPMNKKYFQIINL